jgi:hypothetical protein
MLATIILKAGRRQSSKFVYSNRPKIVPREQNDFHAMTG